MVFGDSAGGDSGKICRGVEPVVFGADMNVVDVEQQAAIGHRDQRTQEFGL